MYSRESKAVAVLCLLVGMLAFAFGAIWNGFPLLLHDSGSYILDGFTGDYIAVRTVAYSLFVYYTSLFGTSVWHVILLQSLMLSFVFWRIQTEVFGYQSPWKICLNSLCASLLFGGTWIESQITADAMTPIVILSFLLLLLPTKESKANRLLIGLIFFVSCLCHFSHLPILTIAYLSVCLLSVPSKTRVARLRLKGAGLMLAGAWLLAPLVNAAFSGHLKPVEAYQPHLLGRLAETGVLGRLLTEHCQETKYLFCPYWPPKSLSAKDMIWDEDGLIPKTLGHTDNPAYAQMIRDSIRHYPGMLLVAELKSTALQLYRTKFGDRLYSYASQPWVETVIRKCIPHEYVNFRSARQQMGSLSFAWPNLLLLLSLFASALIFGDRTFRAQLSLASSATWSVIFVALCVVVNATVCASTSLVADRYQARVTWILPALLLPFYFESRKKT